MRSDNFPEKAVRKLLEKGYVVYAPVKVKDLCLFRQVNSAENLDFSRNPRNSAKIAVFSENEVLIRYGDWIEEIPINDKKIAVVGIRACDAKAIKLLDKIFLEGFEDPYYKARRENLLTIAIACDKAGDYCFCTSVGINPRRPDADIVYEEIDGKGFVYANTAKGEEFLKNFEAAEDEKEKELRENFESKAIEMRELKFDVENLRKNFENPFWKEVATNCVSCGVCTYLCPTCFCFDIYDDGEKKGVRIRSWDSCQFQLHTLESSSHNPRPEKWQRLRNRFYDKFLYTLRRGGYFCVGCGRCGENCPRGIDIFDVIEVMG